MSGNYRFRFPVNVPPMTFEALSARLAAICGRANCLSDCDLIGITVQVRWMNQDHSAVLVRLYETTIAILAADGTIRFPNDDPHQASTAWINKILADNGLGFAWRIRRLASDEPGPPVARGKAGLLCIGGDHSKPVHGRTWRAKAKVTA